MTDLDRYCHIRDVVKMVGRIGLTVTPLFIIAFMGIRTLSGVEAGPPETAVNAILEATVEDRTRAILHSDLNEAWNHYESGDYSEDMWKGVYTHVVGIWNEQAKGKGWIEFGWAPPKHDEPTQLSSTQTEVR
ncbi:MAG: hypothetical protein QGD90_11410 [Candidatus Hydrogenedentes bacterium]|nr:hypothetical protein [Candidatus Hydrogenedentota bacterium]